MYHAVSGYFFRSVRSVITCRQANFWGGWH